MHALTRDGVKVKAEFGQKNPNFENLEPFQY